MIKLFTPITIKSLSLKNRIVMSPMCQYSAADGFVSDWHYVHYGSRAVGGAALIMVEATAVSPEGRITPGDLGIWSDDHIAGLAKITALIHAHGAVAGIQIAHAGRKASSALPKDGGKQLRENDGGWHTVGPSDIPFLETDRAPKALEQKELRKIREDFRNAVMRAKAAGFNIIEIHSAHGYLLHEFLSPLSNKRDDEYGGSFENRTCLLREIVADVRTVWPTENPLFVRISSTDWTEGGWTIDDSTRLAGLLKELDVDLIDCSSGGNVPNVKIPASPGYQLPFSEAIRKTGILTGAVGMITSATQAETALAEDKADLVFLGRELLRNPYFPLHAAKELGAEIKWPEQYLRAR